MRFQGLNFILKLGGSGRDVRLCMPDHWLNRSDKEDPNENADHRDRCQDYERPVEVTCALDHKSGDGRSHDSRKIADAALETCPSSSCCGSREPLSDGK
jgi:hypothetical protein